MSDIKIYKIHLSGDILIENGEIALDNSLESSIIVSLFSGNIANFWGNGIQSDLIPIGGVFERELYKKPLSTQRLEILKTYIITDLQWLVDQQLVNSFNAFLTQEMNNTLHIQIDCIVANTSTSIVIKKEI